jgi:branched-subunit amino acid aminotransferase/4-amino-4-deoxychorismate lyase
MPGVTVSERPLTIGQLRRAAAAGQLREVFGSGTACVVQPVGGLVLGSGEQLQPRAAAAQQGAAQPWLWQQLLQTLTDIQYGRLEHEWSVPFE